RQKLCMRYLAQFKASRVFMTVAQTKPSLQSVNSTIETSLPKRNQFTQEEIEIAAQLDPT
ncbi:1399_t:CDS:1, partial [Racocetra persica]